MKLALLAGIVAIVTVPAFGSSLCAAGGLSGIIGTTCDIGPLQFTFISLDTYGNSYSASDFTLTPVRLGFTLGFDGGFQSFTAPADSSGEEYAELSYNVTDLLGDITWENVAGGALSASGSSFSEASYQGATYSPKGDYVRGICQAIQLSGVMYGTSCGSGGISGSPFPASNYAYAFPLYLEGGPGDSASWDWSPTTFTYTITPEPSSLLLFGAGLARLAGAVRRRLWR